MGYKPKLCVICVNKDSCKKKDKIFVNCKKFVEARPKPPTSTSNMKIMPQAKHIITHFHCDDITKDFLEKYKVAIEHATAVKLYKEIDKVITLLEFTMAIDAESVTIQAAEIPLLLNGLKKQLAENERIRNLFKPFNFPKK